MSTKVALFADTPGDESDVPCDEPKWSEVDRITALERHAILDTGREAAFDEIAALAAEILETPIAVVNLIASDRQWFKAEVGIGTDSLPLDVSICRHAILQPGVMVVPDLALDPRFKDNPLVHVAGGLRFYAGALMETSDGLPLGTVCVLAREPRANGISDRQRRTLAMLANQAMAQIKLRYAREQAEAGARRQSFLLDLEEHLRSVANPGSAMAAAAERLGRYLGVARVGYAEIADEGGIKVAVIEDDWADGATSIKGRHRLDQFGAGFSAEMRIGRTIRANDIATDPLFVGAGAEAFSAFGVRAAITPTLVKNGCPVAMLFVHAEAPRRWTDDEVGLVEEVAERTWSAVARARAEAALRDSEFRYRSALRVGRIGSWETDYACGVRRWSPEGMAMFGIELHDGLGRVGGPDDEWRAALHPDERDFPDTLTQDIHHLDQREVEYRIVRPDGRVCWLHGYIQVLERDAHGGVTRSLNVAADITARREAEVALRESEERQAFLLRLSDALRPLSDALQIQRCAVVLMGEHLDVNRVGYFEIGPDEDLIFPTGTWERGLPPLPDRMLISDFGNDIRNGFRAGRTMASTDTAHDAGSEGHKAAVQATEVRAWIGVPLVKDGRWIATVGVHSATPRVWKPSEIQLVEEVAERTWAAVQRARAEVALRESEELFRSMAEAIEDVFYLIDLEHNTLVYLSPRYEEIWGWPAGTILDDLGTFGDTIHPDDRAIAAEAKAGQSRGAPVTVEYRVLRPDGSIRWILDRSFAIPGAVGRRLAGVASDITDRRSAEDRVRAGDLRLRMLMENIRDYAIFTIDIEGNVTSWPAGAELAFGWSEAEMLGRPLETTYLPDDVTQKVPRTEMATAMREGLALNVRWHQRSDKSRVFINGSMQPLVGPDGKVQEFIKIGRDETEKLRVQQALADSEIRLRTLAEGIPQLVWRSRDDGDWTWSSPQWQAFTGQTLGQSLGRGWLDAVHPDDREAAEAAWVTARPSGMLDIEYRVRRASDGAWLWHHTRSLPVRDDFGQIVEWLGTTTDVQELKELQQRQSVMVAELQHRTRNLIAVVGAIARQTMLQTGPTEAFVEEFEHRLAALARVQGLLSRSDEEPVTIISLISMELDALGVSSDGERRVRLEGPPVPLRNAIVQTLALALHELATNALKHGALSQEEGRLTVSWQVVNENGKGHNLALEWTESGTVGEVLTLPDRRGYGRELIERALPYALGARTDYAFTPDGLRCKIEVPLDKKLPRVRRAK